MEAFTYLTIIREKKKQIRLNLTVCKKSLPMSIKFKRILSDYFNKTVNIRKVPSKDNSYSIQTSINKNNKTIQKWRNPNIPDEIKNHRSLFGAYLGGLIDGDGHIKIKNNLTDRKIPQGVIKISSDRPLEEIKKLVEKHIKCKVHFEFDKRSNAVNTCFYISKKSLDFIKEFIYPHLTLQHKILQLDKYFKIKNEPIRI